MAKPRGPGRPRDPAVDDAIEAAAWSVLAEAGSRRLSPERVADRAGVAVSTVYRRFRSADDILLHLMHRLFESLAIPDTGSLHGDLTELMTSLSAALSPIGPRRALIALWAAVEDNTEMGEVHDRAMDTRRDQADRIVTRAVERGELGPHVNPTLVAETLTSYALLRLVNTRDVLSAAAVAEVVDLMLNGILSRRPA